MTDNLEHDTYHTDPRNLPEIWPSLLEVSEVQEDSEGKPAAFKWVYKMAGMRFNGSSRIKEFIPNERTVSESKEGIESHFETTYTDKGGKTEVLERVRYRIPIPLLGRMAEGFLKKTNENELEVRHANLKARMEGEGA